jgi:hypothetical protein
VARETKELSISALACHHGTSKREAKLALDSILVAVGAKSSKVPFLSVTPDIMCSTVGDGFTRLPEQDVIATGALGIKQFFTLLMSNA